ncbi:hypothetical protein DJ82_07085 [Halorubrum sp. Ib24]|nr:hypothetical protein DJ82_07085 [Halorubrum sp. Ib24]OYR44041.1 hypothetical protein DJ75_10190 [Halorubrum sp. Eb13]OYR51446.1 hypothetical protein DJ74_03905 [Halorubrum sp. Ea8]OYR56131.1 hypothetical protein DJ73_00665 [Halorubrum sp. Ea1]
MEPFSVVSITRSVTALVGLFVATLAYRGYQRNSSPKMRALAIGIGLLTAGVYVAVMLADLTGGANGIVLLVRGLVTVIGLSVVLYAITVA